MSAEKNKLKTTIPPHRVSANGGKQGVGASAVSLQRRTDVCENLYYRHDTASCEASGHTWLCLWRTWSCRCLGASCLSLGRTDGACCFTSAVWRELIQLLARFPRRSRHCIIATAALAVRVHGLTLVFVRVLAHCTLTIHTKLSCLLLTRSRCCLR